MALWGKTDATISIPKYLTAADKAKAVFVSTEEALLATNKSKGITGAGWWLLNEYTDSQGTTRYKTECLVAMAVATAISGDADDDAKVSDVEITLTIGTQPTAQTAVDGEATFTVVATVNTGTVTYQWQKKEAGSTRWVNLVDETDDTLVLTDLTNADDDGDQYRVVLGSDSGAKKVNSNAAVLTVAPVEPEEPIEE
jgi:hypothetical protein